jgi:hypothetical protein
MRGVAVFATAGDGEEVSRDSGSTTSRLSSESLRVGGRLGDLAGDLCSVAGTLTTAADALSDCVVEKRGEGPADPERLSARDAMEKLDRSPAEIEGRGEVGSGVMLKPYKSVGEVLRRSCRRRTSGE